MTAVVATAVRSWRTFSSGAFAGDVSDVGVDVIGRCAPSVTAP
jgi:hypothetical protein